LKDIIFKDVVKRYDQDTLVLDKLNFKIEDGQRVVLLGPSGCGKSTTLRIIAGLSDITEGELFLNGKVANDISPKDRDISMVFQNYALYPHMTVKENICYALKINKLNENEIEERFKEAIKTLKLEGLENRKPKDLSGGQRQRVALARALVKKSNYFLLDEPLSNLDAQLRTHARKELVKIHEKYKMTFVYVTHDQVEAMTIGQMIILLNEGKIQMADTPDNIYNHPRNIFTAKFIGSPPMNVIPCRIEDDSYLIKDKKIKLDKRLSDLAKKNKSNEIYLGIRPEHIKITDEKASSVAVKINFLENYGNKIAVYFHIDDEEYVLMSDDKNLEKDQIINIKFPQSKIVFFDKQTELNLEVEE
jgi:ABC-type sugar transport system ATPase subunit